MIHRIGAIVVFITLIWLFFYLKKYKEFHKVLYIMNVLLFIQIVLGIINVMFYLPSISAVAHNFIAVLLFLTLLVLTYNIFTAKNYISKVIFYIILLFNNKVSNYR